MSHLLPPLGHPARDMFDVADLVAIGTRQRDPLTLPQAKAAARRTFAAMGPAARRASFLVIRGDGMLDLVSIGRRGGWIRHWRFGPAWGR